MRLSWGLRDTARDLATQSSSGLAVFRVERGRGAQEKGCCMLQACTHMHTHVHTCMQTHMHTCTHAHVQM